MITTQTMPTTPTRQIKAKVEQYRSSTLVSTYNYNDKLKSIEVERVGDGSKFFGFTICQKAVIKLIDREDTVIVNKNDEFKIYFDYGDGYIKPFPTFYVDIDGVKTDDVNKEITITAYDVLHTANNYTVNQLEIPTEYTIEQFIAECSRQITPNTGYVLENTEIDDTHIYQDGANFDGTETVRQALVAAAEATQTVCYINRDDKLVFKFPYVPNSHLTITANDYFTYTNSPDVYLKGIASITALGDNVETAKREAVDGVVQYVQENPFWVLRDDIQNVLDSAYSHLDEEDPTLMPFNLVWRGNYLLEPGDKITVVTKTDEECNNYIFNDVIKYSGGLSHTIKWNYEATPQTYTNPTTIGDALKKTSAMVDKVNKRIELLVSEEGSNSSKLASLEITTSNISSTVSDIQTATDSLSGQVETLTQNVSSRMTADDVSLMIEEELKNGATSVTTSTGYTFDKDGLTVSKSDSEMTTTITEDGMVVYKNNSAVLTANNVGVDAKNLHATTYLIMGDYSRIENYGNKRRTACFWIGG